MFKKTNEDDILKKRMRECPIFTDLSDADIKYLLRMAHVRDYSTDEIVFSEGTVGLCFYLVVKGMVQIISGDGSSEIVLREYKVGDYFSEVHLFSETTHTVSCTAKELTKLLIFSKPDFENMAKVKPRIGNRVLVNFLHYFAEQLDKLYKQNKELKQELKS